MQLTLNEPSWMDNAMMLTPIIHALLVNRSCLGCVDKEAEARPDIVHCQCNFAHFSPGRNAGIIFLVDTMTPRIFLWVLG